MTELITRSGAWALQQVVALDTVVMKTVPAERGWFETMSGIASGVMSLVLLLLLIVFAPAAWSFWKTFRRTRELVERVNADITPLTRHATNIADNLEYITASIRNDVQQVNATIASANRRLQQAVELTETRLNEFNALLQVVQQEAEQAFVSTASVVRGVRKGAATLGGSFVGSADNDVSVGERKGEGFENDDDGESEATALDAGRHGEDGGGGEERSDARQAPARPRVRSRRRSRE